MAFTFDKSRRRYINSATGRALSDREMRRIVSETSQNARQRAQALAEDLNAGRITQPEFMLGMQAEIRQGERAMATLAYGGYEQMDAGRWARAGAYTREQQQYLIRFGADIATGSATPAEIRNRAGMYQESLASSYQGHLRAREQQAGVTRMRRHLDPGAEHCDGCKAAEGEHDIESVPAIGAQECGARCRCWLESVKVEASQEAAA